MKRQTNWIVGVSDGKVHEYKIGDVTYFVSAEFERSSQTNLRDRVQRTVVSDLIPLTPDQASDTMTDEYDCSTVGKDKCSRKTKIEWG